MARRTIKTKLDAAMWQVIAATPRYKDLDTTGRKDMRHGIKRRMQDAFGTAAEIEESQTTVAELVAEHINH